MLVKEYDDGTLVLDGKILEGAREAYQEDRIVESFTLLHAFIEWEMLNLYEHSHIVKGANLATLRPQIQKQRARFEWLRKKLCTKKLIKSHENEKLMEWYDLRNRIIHRLVAYSFHPSEFNRVTREEVKEGFRKGEELADILGVPRARGFLLF